MIVLSIFGKRSFGFCSLINRLVELSDMSSIVILGWVKVLCICWNGVILVCVMIVFVVLRCCVLGVLECILRLLSFLSSVVRLFVMRLVNLRLIVFCVVKEWFLRIVFFVSVRLWLLCFVSE